MLARKIILGFGFAILMPLLIHQGIEVVAPTSDSRQHYRELDRLREEEREASGAAREALRSRREHIETAEQARRDQSERIHFFVGAPVGIIVTLLGSFIRVQAVGGGLMLGGIFTFGGGCVYYWSDLSRGGRFSVLLVAFAVLLWIGYQRLSELKQPAKAS